MFRTALLGFVLSLSAPALASQSPAENGSADPEPAVPHGGPTGKADTAEKFSMLIERIHDEMRPGGNYEFITADRRREADELFDQMSRLMHKRGAVADMTYEEKIALFNAQEKVNGILTNSDSRRVLCDSTAPVGSHIAVTTCRTYGDIEARRRRTSEFLNDRSARLGCGPGADGSCVTGPDRLLNATLRDAHMPHGQQ